MRLQLLFLFVFSLACRIAPPAAAAETAAITWSGDGQAMVLEQPQPAVDVAFTATNRSPRPVRVETITPSCDCTRVVSPALPWTLAPGESGVVTARMELHATSGDFSRSLAVQTSEGPRELTFRVVLKPAPAVAGPSADPVVLLCSEGPPPAVEHARQEFLALLRRIYPRETIVASDRLPGSGRVIVLNWQRGAGVPVLAGGESPAWPTLLAEPESYAIRQGRVGANDVAIVAGADERGLTYALYALLERLGCGFYLSFDTTPAPRTERLAFESWTCANAPLVHDRIMLDWHNFLSSATTWELSDWKRYIDASARMGFNDLMVHAYGNNPMFTFTFNGVSKPVGYFATTQRGRDWGTQHVNDVRRLVGGEVFDDAVFGASIAKGDAADRVAATTRLMQQVFRHARDRGLGVTFALDVDPVAANPQEIIRTLPEAARFKAGNVWLANPDTPEGFAYYEAQLDQLLALYPELTRVVVWFRSPEANTSWRRMLRTEMPSAWQREFDGPDEDVSAYALAKVVHAFQRANQARGPRAVRLAAGSWAFPFLAASDRFIDRGIPLFALDWWVSFDTARALRDIQRLRPGREFVPFVWPHHDDSTHLGRPYTPWVDFATKLQRVGATGFGVNHWNTRPLDLYFKATIAQVWAATRDQPLQESCDDFAARLLGPAARQLGGQYFFSWITEAPMFGRETTAHFIDRPLPAPEEHARLAHERLALLARLKALPLSAEAQVHREYFERYERFMLSFFATQKAVEEASAALNRGDYAGARTAIAVAKPEAVIADYAAAAQVGRITRGEQAMIVSLNLRWLPDVLSIRQAVGLEPIRYRLGEVQLEPLAQGAAPNTYYVDAERHFWKVIDPARAGGELVLRPFAGQPLAPGRYAVAGVGVFDAQDGAIRLRTATAPAEIVIAPAAADEGRSAAAAKKAEGNSKPRSGGAE